MAAVIALDAEVNTTKMAISARLSELRELLETGDKQKVAIQIKAMMNELSGEVLPDLIADLSDDLLIDTSKKIAEEEQQLPTEEPFQPVVQNHTSAKGGQASTHAESPVFPHQEPFHPIAEEQKS